MDAEANDADNRSFKIKRMRPEDSSYAQDIAEKYGLTLEKIGARIKLGQPKQRNFLV